MFFQLFLDSFARMLLLANVTDLILIWLKVKCLGDIFVALNIGRSRASLLDRYIILTKH